MAGTNVLFKLCELRGSEPRWTVRWVTHVETPKRTTMAARARMFTRTLYTDKFRPKITEWTSRETREWGW